jgi:hypothetical protein
MAPPGRNLPGTVLRLHRFAKHSPVLAPIAPGCQSIAALRHTRWGRTGCPVRACSPWCCTGAPSSPAATSGRLTCTFPGASHGKRQRAALCASSALPRSSCGKLMGRTGICLSQHTSGPELLRAHYSSLPGGRIASRQIFFSIELRSHHRPGSAQDRCRVKQKRCPPSARPPGKKVGNCPIFRNQLGDEPVVSLGEPAKHPAIYARRASTNTAG